MSREYPSNWRAAEQALQRRTRPPKWLSIPRGARQAPLPTMRLALAALALAATFGLSLGFGSFMPNPGRQEERDRCVAAAAGDVAQTMAKHAIREFLLDNGKRDLGELYDLRTYTNASGVVHYPYVFSKTLAHDPTTGFPAKADVDRVLHFVSAPCTDNLDAIKLAPGHERKLEGVATVWNRNPVGADPPEMAFPIWYPIESAESAFEMAEVCAAHQLPRS